MMLRTFALAAALLAAAAPAGAETWRASSSDGAIVAYIDVDSIERSGDRVIFRRELRFPDIRTLGNGRLRFDRLQALYHGDCRAMTLRNMSVRAKLGDAIVLEGEGSLEIESVATGSTAERDLRAACLGEWADPRLNAPNAPPTR